MIKKEYDAKPSIGTEDLIEVHWPIAAASIMSAAHTGGVELADCIDLDTEERFVLAKCADGAFRLTPDDVYSIAKAFRRLPRGSVCPRCEEFQAKVVPVLVHLADEAKRKGVH